MSDEEIDRVAHERRADPNDPNRARQKSDPLPIIERQYPRIAASIRELWGKRALDDYFSQLVLDERGARQGFPPDVLAAILEVAWLHNREFSFTEGKTSPWDVDASQKKWWDR